MDILRNKPVFKIKYNDWGEVFIIANDFEDAFKQFRRDFSDLELYKIKEIEHAGFSNIALDIEEKLP